MTLTLQKENFFNDFQRIAYTPVKTAVFNTVSEQFELSGRLVDINGISIQQEVNNRDGTTTVNPCTNIIGLSDGILSISSDYADLQGVSLSTENIERCTIELYE